MEELQKDLAELESIESQVKRQRVKNILTVEIKKLQTEICHLRQIETPHVQPTNSASVATTKRYQIKLNNYAWDQSTKFVKFYITLQKIQTLPSENIVCNFTNKSLELHVTNLDNKDYVFTINNLLMPIDPKESNWKVKSDMILINVAKVKQENWDFVTETEKRTHDAKNTPLPLNDGDPSQGLMSLMKNMYDQGDDEMKRTIAKAWYEGQAKGLSF